VEEKRITMAFEKSLDLMRLAEMAAARHKGVSLVEVSAEFGVNLRTAQRMIRGLEAAFPSVEFSTDQDRRRWWKLSDTRILGMQGIRDGELEALDMSIRRAQREGATKDVSTLISLRDRLLATMPSSHARRAEVDAEAMLEAQGYACRPGPRVQVEPHILGAIAVAIKAPFSLTIAYRGARDDAALDRVVEPYGMLLGIRQYLIARDLGNGRAFRRFRLDRITSAKITGQSFARDPDFDLDAYAAQSFGSYHSDLEYQPVVWRFAPSAAAAAREFAFHPNQVVSEDPDGALRVAFTASGWVEMAWHLYQWGDSVEVIAPAELRDLVRGHQRGDVGVLP
jgi:predicted DNA-binding transcriptional regulator YafY